MIDFGTVRLTGDPTQPSQFGFDASGLTNEIGNILQTPALHAVSDACRQLATSAAPMRRPLKVLTFRCLTIPPR